MAILLFRPTGEDGHYVAEAETFRQAVQGTLDEGGPQSAGPTAPSHGFLDCEIPRFEQGYEIPQGEQVEVIVDRAPPFRSEKPRLKAVGVRGRQHDDASGRQHPRGLVEEGPGVVQVLDQVRGVDQVEAGGGEGGRFDKALRIPVEYLAELFTAGDPQPVTGVLRTLAAMRSHMRAVNLGEQPDPSIAAAAGLTTEEIEALYRLLAIAKYEDRYVIPAAHVELAGALEELPGCSVDFTAPRQPVFIGVGEVTARPAAAETFDIARRRAEADRHSDLGTGSGDGAR